MATVRVDVRSVLRAPVGRRAWTELAYVLVSAPLAALGFGYVLVCLLLGAALAVTALGVPLLALAVPGTRGFGRARLWLCRALLGEDVAAPEPFRAGRGLFARLRDGVGWRAVAFQFVSLPLTVVSLAVVAVSWGWGLVALTAPIQRALGLNQSRLPPVPSGGPGALGEPARHGVVVLGVVVAGWGGVAALSLVGALLVLVAPWAVRAVLVLDRLLVRALLGRDERSARIAALRRSRAGAVEGAAVELRRIERDLHDGVQARLVALAMHLTMASETFGRDRDGSLQMLVHARDDARAAIRELREVIQGIHPPILDSGLGAAVATLAARSPVPVDCRVEIRERPSPALETIAYFSLAELLSNIARHSGATRASIVVGQPEGGGLRLVVTDDGRGSAGAASNGSGLRGLADRVATVDGALGIVSPPGGPTVITVSLPPPL